MKTESLPHSLHFQTARNFAVGLWRLADPMISLASFASIFLGACAAAVSRLDLHWLGLTALGIFAIEIAKNASGEIFDFDSGADLAVSPGDRSPFSGGKRVLVDGLLTRAETIAISAICYAIGVALGLWIAYARAPIVLWIGLIGVTLAYQYHAPPLKLSYRGFGEIAVALCYGPLIAIGTYVVQVQAVDLRFILSTLPLGLLIASFLWINEFPDYAADKQAGKNTLVVRLGRRQSARVFVGLQATAFILLAALLFAGVTPWTLLGLFGIVPSTGAARRLLASCENTPALIPAQRATLQTFLILAAGQGIGFLAARAIPL